MKKFSAVILAFLMLLLAGCGGVSNADTLKVTEFSKETQNAMQIFQNRVRFFDVNAGGITGYKTELWICRDGIWSAETSSWNDELESNPEQIAIEAPFGGGPLIFHVIDKDGFSTVGINLPQDVFSDEKGSVSMIRSNDTEIIPDKEIVLWCQLEMTDGDTWSSDMQNFRESDAKAGLAYTITFTKDNQTN
ncbi:MAG: hypothetical protein DBX41_03385 [Clostridiales bacterium]|nr:MAG: hypothetical protein DBX41_03385 [Clostridiales bacterium]